MGQTVALVLIGLTILVLVALHLATIRLLPAMLEEEEDHGDDHGGDHGGPAA